MASLLSTVERLVSLERDCKEVLPNGFATSRVLHLEAGDLLLAVPNAAYAAKMKQQLPKLKDGLEKRGWQVNAIRLKVQAAGVVEQERPQKTLALPPQATAAFSELDQNLEKNAGNAALRQALHNLLARHQR